MVWRISMVGGMQIDEAKDAGGKEEMAIVLRFVDGQGSIKERFFDIVQVENTVASTLKKKIARKVASGDGAHQNETLDAMAERALQCPCVAELRSGPCGSNFSDAFLCFIKSTSQEKGSDCVHPFVALQKCIKANPNAFSKDVLDDAEGREIEEQVTRGTKIIPPSWSREPK
ncbi:hypothetical protein Syun_022276 [Stephania yunnanensis]|uniref:Mitochondrial intermembrane space import and assembly protein 40 homolog n=1 Tax=Stephania yunnanensis TaxID=152371 RepID=A0AAP0F951_9MAGN